MKTTKPEVFYRSYNLRSTSKLNLTEPKPLTPIKNRKRKNLDDSGCFSDINETSSSTDEPERQEVISQTIDESQPRNFLWANSQKHIVCEDDFKENNLPFNFKFPTKRFKKAVPKIKRHDIAKKNHTIDCSVDKRIDRSLVTTQEDIFAESDLFDEKDKLQSERECDKANQYLKNDGRKTYSIFTESQLLNDEYLIEESITQTQSEKSAVVIEENQMPKLNSTNQTETKNVLKFNDDNLLKTQLSNDDEQLEPTLTLKGSIFDSIFEQELIKSESEQREGLLLNKHHDTNSQRFVEIKNNQNKSKKRRAKNKKTTRKPKSLTDKLVKNKSQKVVKAEADESETPIKNHVEDTKNTYVQLTSDESGIGSIPLDKTQIYGSHVDWGLEKNSELLDGTPHVFGDGFLNDDCNRFGDITNAADDFFLLELPVRNGTMAAGDVSYRSSLESTQGNDQETQLYDVFGEKLGNVNVSILKAATQQATQGNGNGTIIIENSQNESQVIAEWIPSQPTVEVNSPISTNEASGVQILNVQVLPERINLPWKNNTNKMKFGCEMIFKSEPSLKRYRTPVKERSETERFVKESDDEPVRFKPFVLRPPERILDNGLCFLEHLSIRLIPNMPQHRIAHVQRAIDCVNYVERNFPTKNYLIKNMTIKYRINDAKTYKCVPVFEHNVSLGKLTSARKILTSHECATYKFKYLELDMSFISKTRLYNSAYDDFPVVLSRVIDAMKNLRISRMNLERVRVIFNDDTIGQDLLEHARMMLDALDVADTVVDLSEFSCLPKDELVAEKNLTCTTTRLEKLKNLVGKEAPIQTMEKNTRVIDVDCEIVSDLNEILSDKITFRRPRFNPFVEPERKLMTIMQDRVVEGYLSNKNNGKSVKKVGKLSKLKKKVQTNCVDSAYESSV